MLIDSQTVSIHKFLFDRDSSLRVEIERHRDRTMTVVSRGGEEAITRCGTCPWEDVRPCTGLRILALPYAGHPDYQPEWELVPEPAEASGSSPAADSGVGEHVPPPYPRIADLPPPGNARRRLLRDYGIRIGREDFSNDELTRRGIAGGYRLPKDL